MRNPNLTVGRLDVDLLNPKAEQIDLRCLERNLWTARRFSNCPEALLVRQHTGLAKDLAVLLNGSISAIRWAEHHDDHEGIIGDIPGPLKSWINTQMHPHTDLNDIEKRLDAAICVARGIVEPDCMVRQEVHTYDKLAETLEWIFVLGQDHAPWNLIWRNYVSFDEAKALTQKAKKAKPPEGLFRKNESD